jgi:hypothetical protein
MPMLQAEAYEVKRLPRLIRKRGEPCVSAVVVELVSKRMLLRL